MSVLRTFTVTVANPGSGNRYYIDGVLQDTVNIAEGGTYRFDQSDSSNSSHPLRFSTTSDGTHGGGSEYTIGVTTNGIPGYANAYTEITVATSAPTLYYYCTNHSGMGGQANTPASDTYGVLPWNTGSWAAQGDSTVQLTGFGLNISEGNVVSSISTGWGALTWGSGEWGELKDTSVTLSSNLLNTSLGTSLGLGSSTANVSGIELTSQSGQLSYTATYTFTGIQATISQTGVFAGELNTVSVTSPSNDEWGTDNWGAGMWGVGDGVTIFTGSPDISANGSVTLTGVEATLTSGTAVAGASALVLPTGSSATFSLGNEFAGEQVTVEVTSPSNDEWGTEYWGAGFWGVGDGTTILSGTLDITADASVSVTGLGLTSNTNQIVIPVNIDGIGIQSTTGTVFGGPVVQISVTTASAQPWGQAGWGDGQWGQSVGTDIAIGGSVIGLPKQDVNVTGQQLSSTTGNETITADANLTLTGVSSTVQLGDEDAFTNVRINVTGQELGPFEIGSYQAGISDTALPTGVTMTPSTGIMSVNAWELVDPGTAPTWTVVDKAA